MSMILMHANRVAPSTTADDWAALIAISAKDVGSAYASEGYVRLTPATIVAVAALLDGAGLTNGETVRTYDFSDIYDGVEHVEAHVNAFGPSILDTDRLEALRALLTPFPIAFAMLEEILARGLQVSLSTETPGGGAMAHLNAVNWPADEVEIRLSGGLMRQMLGDIGIDPGPAGSEMGEVAFETFAKAVNDNQARTEYPSERLQAFVACARRHAATHVYWA